MPVRAVDFESTASANSATRATESADASFAPTGVHEKLRQRKIERHRTARVFPRVSYPFFSVSS